MTTKKELQSKIEELESQLTEFKSQLANFKEYPDIAVAKAGDTLEDGSVVIYNPSNVAVVIAPKDTQCLCEWSLTFATPLNNALAHRGFKPSEWFIPTAKQLQYAMTVVPEQFSKGSYWTSEGFQQNHLRCGMAISFNGKDFGIPHSLTRSLTINVRAFRCIFH